jgi:hypothetical protein
MSDFFTGNVKKSPREGFVVYVGSTIFGVKWRDWKLLFKELPTPLGEIREFQSPRCSAGYVMEKTNRNRPCGARMKYLQVTFAPEALPGASRFSRSGQTPAIQT